MSPAIRTQRLRLREWRDEDLIPFATMNADAAVMEFLPGVLTREESDELAARIRDHFARHGYGLWAVEIPERSNFAGFVGLTIPTFEAHFMPCVEVGWRLAAPHWGQGYATEAARAALHHGFTKLDLAEIVSFTIPENTRSQRVMQKIGMRSDPSENFDHPRFPVGHRLRGHVLYRVKP